MSSHRQLKPASPYLKGRRTLRAYRHIPIFSLFFLLFSQVRMLCVVTWRGGKRAWRKRRLQTIQKFLAHPHSSYYQTRCSKPRKLRSAKTLKPRRAKSATRLVAKTKQLWKVHWVSLLAQTRYQQLFHFLLFYFGSLSSATYFLPLRLDS